jgi:hypothetical protein
MAGPQTSSWALSISSRSAISRAGVPACERRYRGFVALDQRDAGQTVGVPLFDQPGELGAAVAAGVLEVAQQHATVVFTATRVVKAFEHPADVRVTLHVAAVGRKRDFGAAVKKLLDLFNRAKPRLIHVDHHFWMINPLTNSPQIVASGSFLLGNTGQPSGSCLIGQGLCTYPWRAGCILFTAHVGGASGCASACVPSRPCTKQPARHDHPCDQPAIAIV